MFSLPTIRSRILSRHRQSCLREQVAGICEMAVVQGSLCLLDGWLHYCCWYCQLMGGSLWGDNYSCWDGQRRKKQPLPPLIFPSIQQAQEQQAFKISGTLHLFPLALFLLLPLLLPWHIKSSSPVYSPYEISTWGFLLFNSSLAKIPEGYVLPHHCTWHHFCMSTTKRVVLILCKCSLQHLALFFQKTQQPCENCSFILVSLLPFLSVTVLEQQQTFNIYVHLHINNW